MSWFARAAHAVAEAKFLLSVLHALPVQTPQRALVLIGSAVAGTHGVVGFTAFTVALPAPAHVH